MASISVIVPVYNVEPFLRRCVDSILHQSFSDFELILVDDGSPDQCGSICDEYAKTDHRVRVIHQKNGGLSAARNAGIDWCFANSHSQWLTFIDSDDWIHNQYLELLYDAANKFNVRISSIGRFDTDGDAPLPERTYIPFSLVSPMDIFNDIGGTVAVRKLYAKDLFQSLRFPLNKLHEDEFTTYLLLFPQASIAKVDEPMYYYYRRPDSIMHQAWTVRRLDVLEAKEAQLAFFAKNNFDEQYSITYKHYLNHISQNYRQLKELKPANHKKYIRQLQSKARQAIKQHGSATKPTIKTFPHIYEIAHPVIMSVYWTYKGLCYKFSKKNPK